MELGKDCLEGVWAEAGQPWEGQQVPVRPRSEYEGVGSTKYKCRGHKRQYYAAAVLHTFLMHARAEQYQRSTVVLTRFL